MLRAAAAGARDEKGEWVGARRTYARWELARTALLENPDGYHEG